MANSVIPHTPHLYGASGYAFARNGLSAVRLGVGTIVRNGIKHYFHLEDQTNDVWKIPGGIQPR
jgi:hypothetical protein